MPGYGRRPLRSEKPGPGGGPGDSIIVIIISPFFFSQRSLVKMGFVVRRNDGFLEEGKNNAKKDAISPLLSHFLPEPEISGLIRAAPHIVGNFQRCNRPMTPAFEGHFGVPSTQPLLHATKLSARRSPDFFVKTQSLCVCECPHSGARGPRRD